MKQLIHQFAIKHLLFTAFLLLFHTTIQGQNLNNPIVPSDTVQARRLLGEGQKLFNSQQLVLASAKLKEAKRIHDSLRIFNNQYLFILYSMARTEDQLNNYNSAIELFQRAVEFKKANLEGESLGMASLLYYYGITLKNDGQYQKAKQIHTEALTIREKKLPIGHELIVTTMGALSDDYRYLSEFDKAQAYLDTAIQILEKSSDKIQISIFKYKQSQLFREINNLREALKSVNKAIELARELSDEDHLANYFLGGGLIALDLGDIKSAIEYNHEALKIYSKNKEYYEMNIAFAYNNLGLCFSDLLDHQKAIDNFIVALNILRNNLGENHPNLSKIYSNLAGELIFIGEQQKGLEVLRKGLRINQNLSKEDNPSIGNSYNDLSLAYNNIFMSDSAIVYANMAIEQDALIDSSYNGIVFSYAFYNLGVAYKRKKNYELAKSYYMKSLAIKRKLTAETLYDYAEIATCYALSEDYFSALIYLDSAMVNANQLFQSNLNIGLIKLINNKIYVLLKLFEQSKELKYLNHADSIFQYVVNKTDDFIAFSEGSTKITFLSEFNIFLNNSYRLLNALEKQNQVSAFEKKFNLAEKSKSIVLLNSLKSVNASQIAGIPDSILALEHDLMTDITFYDKQIQLKFTNRPRETDTSFLHISNELINVKRIYADLQRQMEIGFPKYYKAKYDLRTVPLNYVQDTLLQPGQSLLEYFVGDSSIYLFLVQPKNYEVIEIKKDTAFNQWVEDLTRNGIYGYYGKKGVSKGKSIANYGTSAYQLYETLIAPVKAKLPKDEKLIIIPDGILGYVPFEALLTQKPPRPDAVAAYKYLIQDHQISYCYSATLLKEMRNKKHRQEPTQKLLAMAPFFLGNADTLLSQVDSTEFMAGITLRDTLTALPNSGEEVARIHKILKGQAFYGKAATMVAIPKISRPSAYPPPFHPRQSRRPARRLCLPGLWHAQCTRYF